MLPDRSSVRRQSAFSLVEVLIVMTLLALIVFALMNVFSSTQRAFRASVTQTDVLEGSRAAMELMTTDLRRMTTQGVSTNSNFVSLDNNYIPALQYAPLQQTLPGSTQNRVNALNYFYILSRENNTWVGVGYAVVPSTTTSLYTLYRYYATVPIQKAPWGLYYSFTNMLYTGQWTNTAYMSPLVNGVVNLTVRSYDPQGIWMINGYSVTMTPPTNSYFTVPVNGEVGFLFNGSTIPAAVELQMGVLEDHAVARAVSLPNNIPAAPPNDRRSQYLLSQAGSVHIFRQQVNIENVDRSVYP